MKYVLKFIMAVIVITLCMVLDTIYMMVVFTYAMIHNYLLIRDIRKVLSYWVNDMNNAANTYFKMGSDFIFT